MILLGYAGAILMGLSLGLIGCGGSILTVPILVYFFGVDAVTATGYSLFVVGLTSAVGSLSHIRLGNIHWQTAAVFGLPSIVAVFLTRLYLMPAIPNPVLRMAGFSLSKDLFLLLLFAVLMVLASISMIRQRSLRNEESKIQFRYGFIFLEGLVVGMVTGLVGAGGGFLIIPALVLLANLPMKQAIGTSLIIIAAKSLIGFLGDLHTGNSIQWTFLLSFSLVAMTGILLGSFLLKRVHEARLKPAFGWFVLAMGFYIIAKEVGGL